MRTLATGPAALLLAVAMSSASAAAIPEPQPLAPAVAAIFADADADRNGVVTRAELDKALSAFTANVKPGFERDWGTMLRVVGLDQAADRIDFPASARGVLAMCEKADADNDGVVDLLEAAAFGAALPEDDRDSAIEFMVSADRNGDGTVDAAEIAALRTDLENYLSIDAMDPDSLPQGNAVTKSAMFASFEARAQAVRADAVSRFERVAGTTAEARLGLLQADADRVAEAQPAE